MFKFTICLLVLQLATSISFIRCEENIFMTIEELPEPGSNTSVIGPPGPVGRVGFPGHKGTAGCIGTCQCEIERVKRQRDIISKSKAIQQNNHAERTMFRYKQNPDSCSVGIKTGKLNNSAMTASSFSSIPYSPYFARLDNLSNDRTNRGTWLPDQKEKWPENWIQVSFVQPKRTTGIITQGYQYNDLWISSFKMSYGNHTDQLFFIKADGQDKIFIGNHDRSTYKINMFSEAITGRYFRLYVVTFKTYIVLRMELLTC